MKIVFIVITPYHEQVTGFSTAMLAKEFIEYVTEGTDASPDDFTIHEVTIDGMV